MGTLIALTCILSTLIARGHAIHCTVCRTEGEVFSCVGDDKECGKDTVCASTITITIMAGHTKKSFSRYCARRSNCGASGSIVFQGGFFKKHPPPVVARTTAPPPLLYCRKIPFAVMD
ncbi:unnamed protein product [Staurois parvus]|uniref:Sodefrin-like factor n=1 Tax=Staurois parvus TaxID=386267 RepID=A0ABN9GTN9_9NEOB|nr:unnamed protein product [Staurois parvus]